MKYLILSCLLAAYATLLGMEVSIDLSKQDQLLSAIEESTSKIDEVKNVGLEALKRLIKDPAVDVNFQYPGKDLATPLMHAVKQGNLEAAQLLCQEASVNPNIRDSRGAFPLHEAMIGTDEKGLLIIRLLADKGARINCINVQQQTLLGLALKCLSHDDMIAPNRIIALLALGASSTKDQLELAAEKEHHWLLFNVSTPRGKMKIFFRGVEDAFLDTCLCLAVAGDEVMPNSSICHLLTEIADPNAKDNVFGMTALMWAAARGHLQLAKLLLTHPKVDVNATDNFGDTALHYAARNGHLAVVQLLMAHPESRVGKLNNKGKSPKDLAQLRKHQAIVDTLEKYVKNRLRVGHTLKTIQNQPVMATALPWEIVLMILKHYQKEVTSDNRKEIEKIVELCKRG